VVAAGQTIKIGRTEAADVSFPHDGYMSGIHFQIQVTRDACTITDLGSANFTFVNKARITAPRVLRGGEKISAGKTVFAVAIEAGIAAEAGSVPAARFPGEIVLPRAPCTPGRRESPGLWQSLQGPFTAENCDSGLTLCRGDIAALPAVEVAVRLSRCYPLSLVVDFKHLGRGRPAELTSPQYILDWLAPSAADAVSPLVIPQQDIVAWPAIIQEGWGKDAVICLFSKLGRPKLLEHVRDCCRRPGVPGARGHGSIIGYCWPSVLAPVLSYSKDMACRFMQGIEAVLVELPDLPETWQVYGGKQIVFDLENAGLIREKPQPAKISN
jgi:hypothetical protein